MQRHACPDIYTDTMNLPAGGTPIASELMSHPPVVMVAEGKHVSSDGVAHSANVLHRENTGFPPDCGDSQSNLLTDRQPQSVRIRANSRPELQKNTRNVTN